MKPETAPLSITIKVYRRLDNRAKNLPDDSPYALELHNIRKAALHEALSGVDGLDIDWGTVDDVKSHELGEFVVHILSNPHLHAALVTGISWAALEASKALIGTSVSESVKEIIGHLSHPQKEGKILNYFINVPAGQTVFVSREGDVTVGPTPPPES